MTEAQKMNDAAIVMLPVSSLYPHKDNPRRDVGDVTELAESIKVNGVLQNLTVVPGAFDGNYIVIIGHRRLAAAKLAGLETVPCAIVKMTHEEQIATMLTENMQRTDLTVYEQAKAFQQLSLDLGMSVTEIADMSGFSETTVRRRTKLAELDEAAFKEACDRGATLFDFAELDKVEDPEAKQKCLEAMGTANFKNEVKYALDDQRTKKKMEEWLSQISSFATKIESPQWENGYYYTEIDGEKVMIKYIGNRGPWSSSKEDIEKPDDTEEFRYFYTQTSLQISIYKELIISPEETEAERLKKEISERDDADWDKIRGIQRRHKELRKEFVLNYGAVKSNLPIVMRGLADAIAYAAMNVYLADNDDLCELLGIEYDKDRGMPDRAAYNRIKQEQPERLMLILAYCNFDNCGGYTDRYWNPKLQRYLIRYNDNQQLDDLYYFLEELGYERSDEEKKMSRGTHELFYKEEEE